jgi:hypothetical protein
VTDLSSPTMATAEGPPMGSAHQPLSQEEIQFRAARYRLWLRDQGLHRLDKSEARDTAPQPGTSSDHRGVTEDEVEDKETTE